MPKRPHPSLQGKKPVHKAAISKATAKSKKGVMLKNPSHIANKMKRSEMYGKYLQQKRQLKLEAHRKKQEQDNEEQEDDSLVVQPTKPIPKTLDNTREVEPTLVLNDPEVLADQADDEFAPYLNSSDGNPKHPKVLITTRPRPSQNLFWFVADLQRLIPKLEYYPRKWYSVNEICAFATHREYTHVLVVSQDPNTKECNGLTISHLPMGPTAFFKVSHVVTRQDIPQCGASTAHVSELNLHGLTTRLGHRVGRFLASLFPPQPQFVGRQVVTIHNQRDYLFVRHHRYVFEEKKNKTTTNKKEETDVDKDQETSPTPIQDRVKARLQELGPRFTLKMRWLQEGTFDTKFGEYEWIHKRKEMDTSRRKFHL